MLGVAVSTADRQRWSDRSAAKIDVPRTAWIAPGTPAATVRDVAKNVWQRRVPAEPICQPGRSVSPLATAHVAADPHGVERVGAQGEGLASHARHLGRGPGACNRLQTRTPWSVSRSWKAGAKAKRRRPFKSPAGVLRKARKTTHAGGNCPGHASVPNRVPAPALRQPRGGQRDGPSAGPFHARCVQG
jgi:hypothetical protein